MISLIIVFSAVIGYIMFQFGLWLILRNHKFQGNDYVFNADQLHEISKKGISQPSKEAMFDAVHKELQRLYPKHIQPQRNWLWFNAGGWMGTMCFLHASLTEYVILFGTPNPVSGHSGRYPLEVHDFVMEGEYQNQMEMTTDAVVHKPGSRVYLPPMASCAFVVKDHVWMLEYGRGLLPLALPFQAADTFFSTLDFVSLARAQLCYAKYLLYELFVNRKI